MLKLKSKLQISSTREHVIRTSGPRFEAQFIKYDLEIFLSYVNENMISRIEERTNEQIFKVPKKVVADKF